MTQLIERVGLETRGDHPDADTELIALEREPTRADYHHFLMRSYGFLRPLERSLARTPGFERWIEPRRLHRHDLLRHDLLGFRMSSDEIEQLPECSIPILDGPEEALGWIYPIERGALAHVSLFRQLASVLPGEIAFSGSYLRYDADTAAESWRTFASALDRATSSVEAGEHVIAAARAAFRFRREWRRVYDEQRARSRRRGS